MVINLIICIAVLLVIGIGAVILSKKSEKKDKSDEKSENTCVSESFEETELDRLIDYLDEVSESGDYVYKKRYVPVAPKKTQEIQALLIGKKGIFVFHFLPLEGWLLGNKDSRWWTFFVSTDERSYLNNPIWYCRDLIEELEVFFPTTVDSDYHAGVIFSDKCELRSVEFSEGYYLGNLRRFMNDFSQYYSELEPVFDQVTVEKMAQVFNVMDNADKVVNRLKALQRSLLVEKEAMIRQEASRKEELELTGDILAALTPEQRQELREARHIKKYDPEERFTRPEIALRDSLVIWRKQQAEASDISVIEIFDNRALDGIVNRRPHTLEDLRKIPGLSEDKIQAYGKTILTMVKHAPVE